MSNILQQNYVTKVR